MDGLYLLITLTEGGPEFETLMYVRNIWGAVHCVHMILLPVWHTGCHVLAAKPCIFTVNTVMHTNSIVSTVYKSCLSASTDQVVQINGACAKPKCWGNTAKRCCTCVITNMSTKLTKIKNKIYVVLQQVKGTVSWPKGTSKSCFTCVINTYVLNFKCIIIGSY